MEPPVINVAHGGHHGHQHHHGRNAARVIAAMQQFAPNNNNLIRIFGGQYHLRPSKLLDILLRLPPLFIIDFILLMDMGFNHFVDPSKDPLQSKVHLTYANSSSMSDSNMSFQSLLNASNDGNTTYADFEANLWTAYSGAFFSMMATHLMNFMFCLFLLGTSLLWISLSTPQLVTFYTYVWAFSCVPLSFLANTYTVNTLGNHHHHGDGGAVERELSLPLSAFLGSETSACIQLLLANYFIQGVLGIILSTVFKLHMNNNNQFTTSEWMLERLLTVPLLFPSTSMVLIGIGVQGASESLIVRFSTVISIIPASLVTLYIFSKVIGVAIKSVIQSLRLKWQVSVNFGLSTFLENEWSRLRMPSLLRTFWLARFFQQFLLTLTTNPTTLSVTANVTSAIANLTLSDETAWLAFTHGLEILRLLITRGAETLIAVLGMTSVVSKICHHVGAFFTMLAAPNENHEEKSVANVSAILFFILALQTGLTSLEPDKRFSRLLKNLCLLLTALFHFIHNNISPVLMSLSAGHGDSQSASRWKRHFRALAICFFLVLAPLGLMVCLWSWFNVGTWLLAVSAFCVEVVVKVIVTVSVYCLFLYDSKIKDGSWELLDDAVYYVKAFGNSVEFCLAVFLFFNGGWILFFESGGTVRAIMMLIHAYLNIWREARSGWQAFMKRTTAVNKLNSLPDATAEQLETKDDVCAICQMEFSVGNTKVTRCDHYFHSICLRKWLYMQDTCPMCHEVLYEKEKKEGNRASTISRGRVGLPAAGGGAAPGVDANGGNGNPASSDNDNTDDSSDSEDDEEIDHDHATYEAPPIIEQRLQRPPMLSDTSDSELDDYDSRSSPSTQLSTTGDEDEDIIFDSANIVIEAGGLPHNHQHHAVDGLDGGAANNGAEGNVRDVADLLFGDSSASDDDSSSDTTSDSDDVDQLNEVEEDLIHLMDDNSDDQNNDAILRSAGTSSQSSQEDVVDR